MEKTVLETYILNDKDKLIITYENGNIKGLVNNEIRINPINLKLETVSLGMTTIVDGKVKRLTNQLELKCEVEG